MSGHSILYFNGIHVIESLREGDLKTGQFLFEDSIEDKPKEYPDLSVDLATPEDRDEFISYLRGIRDEAVYNDYNPIIHIEAHGDRDGIQLTSMECVDWEEIVPTFREINIATNMNLLVSMSACKGGYFTKLVTPVDRAPVFGIIGPLEDIDDMELKNGFSVFYDELMESFNVNTALEKMNNENPNIDFNYKLSNARNIFVGGYLRYRKDHFTPRAMKRREGIFIEMARNINSVAKCYLDSDLRKLFRKHIDNERMRKNRFERLKRSFFMCDLYPNNYTRFNLGEIDGEV